MQRFQQPLITKDEFIVEDSQTPTRSLITTLSFRSAAIKLETVPSSVFQDL